MFGHRCRDFYKEGLPRTVNFCKYLSEKTEAAFPEVMKHLEANSMSVEVEFVGLIMSLGVQNFPVEVATRVFEIFLLHGTTGLI